MSAGNPNDTASYIRRLAEQHGVSYVRTQSDVLAHHFTRLAGDDVQPDEVEQMLFALQRAGYLSRKDLVRLQATYLRETKL